MAFLKVTNVLAVLFILIIFFDIFRKFEKLRAFILNGESLLYLLP